MSASIQMFVPTSMSIPADVLPLVEQFKQLDARLGDINKVVRAKKEEMGYKGTSDQMKETKEHLYNYMATKQIQKLGAITIQKVRPASVKKDERLVKMATIIEETLDEEIGEDQAAEVAPVVLQALLKK